MRSVFATKFRLHFFFGLKCVIRMPQCELFRCLSLRLAVAIVILVVLVTDIHYP